MRSRFSLLLIAALSLPALAHTTAPPEVQQLSIERAPSMPDMPAQVAAGPAVVSFEVQRAPSVSGAQQEKHTMAFRAKCRITGVHSTNSLHKYPDGSLPIESMHVTLQPVFGAGDDDANKAWSKWTPSGELKLSITNPEIYPELVNGKLFFVDFTPIEG